MNKTGKQTVVKKKKRKKKMKKKKKNNNKKKQKNKKKKKNNNNNRNSKNNNKKKQNKQEEETTTTARTTATTKRSRTRRGRRRRTTTAATITTKKKKRKNNNDNKKRHFCLNHCVFRMNLSKIFFLSCYFHDTCSITYPPTSKKLSCTSTVLSPRTSHHSLDTARSVGVVGCPSSSPWSRSSWGSFFLSSLPDGATGILFKTSTIIHFM